MPRKLNQHGRPWADDEDLYLLWEVQQHTPLGVVAVNVGRTRDAVASRLKYLRAPRGMWMSRAAALYGAVRTLSVMAAKRHITRHL